MEPKSRSIICHIYNSFHFLHLFLAPRPYIAVPKLTSHLQWCRLHLGSPVLWHYHTGWSPPVGPSLFSCDWWWSTGRPPPSVWVSVSAEVISFPLWSVHSMWDSGYQFSELQLSWMNTLWCFLMEILGILPCSAHNGWNYCIYIRKIFQNWFYVALPRLI